jgi:hypothetical protein
LEGCTNVNIFCFIIVKLSADWFTINRLGEISCEMILMLSLIIPIGVCSKTNDAGDVDSKYDCSGVSGVVSGVMYVLAGLIAIDRAGGVNSGGDAWRGPNDRIGLILVFGATTGKGFVDVAVSLPEIG